MTLPSTGDISARGVAAVGSKRSFAFDLNTPETRRLLGHEHQANDEGHHGLFKLENYLMNLIIGSDRNSAKCKADAGFWTVSTDSTNQPNTPGYHTLEGA
jgi:hypothetical protein